LGDYSFNFVRALIGILISAALMAAFYTLVIRNYMDFDLTGHDMVQTRQGVYNQGFSLSEVTGENLQGRIFTPAHIVMFPAVDSHIYLESEVAGHRVLRIYNKIRLRHDAAVPFDSDLLWKRTHIMSLTSVQNRAALFRSFNIPLPNDMPSNFNWTWLVNNAPDGGWFGVVNGAANGTSDWLLFGIEQSDRLLIPMP